MNYAPVSYWYLAPGGKCSVTPDIEGAKVTPALSPIDIVQPLFKNGRIEGEELLVTDKQGNASCQTNVVKEWSNNAQLWWKDQKVGDKMTVKFIADKNYNGTLTIAFTQATDYGTPNI